MGAPRELLRAVPRGPRAFRFFELGLLGAILVGQALLFTRPIHSATNFDEDVYLAATDALRHGQALGHDVFAAQFPGFYDLLRGLSYVTGLSVVGLRAGVLGVVVAGTVGVFLIGRRFGGPIGGLTAAAFVTVAPPLDLFSYQVIADTPALAVTALALGVATLEGTFFAALAGVLFAAALSVKLSAAVAIPTLLWLARRHVVAVVSGAVAAGAAVLLSHVGSLGALWASGVTYHERARSTPNVMAHPHRQIFAQIPHSTPFFWLAIASGVIGLAAMVVRRPLGVWPLWVWVVLGCAFLFAHRPLHDNHLVDFPFPLAVASGATLGVAITRIDRRIAACSVGFLAILVAGAYVQQWHRVALVREGEPASNVQAAHALSHLTRPGALVVDDRPIISFLAHRRVVGGLVDLATLRFETGSLDDSKVIRELGQADAVVVSRELRRHPRILAAVRRGFVQRYDRGGVVIWIRNGTPRGH